MKKFIKIFISIILVLALICAVLELGTLFCHHEKAWSPDYDKESLSKVFNKESLTESDYDFVFTQSGLGKSAFDKLREKDDFASLKAIQEDFFKKEDYTVEQFAPFTCYHSLKRDVALPPLENGDIIVTPTTHFSFFEIGHAALVVDANEGKILNSTGYGYKSCIEGIEELSCRPSFVIIRPKISKEKRQEVVDYALNNLLELPYSVLVGLDSKKMSETTTKTNCSHTVWRAYMEFGIDLDSNKGPIVYPRDFLGNSNIEIIQAFGTNLENLK